MMRSYVLPSIENISLWHERDISHSSVERHIAPDATNLLAYMTKRMTQVLRNLVINESKMSERVEANERYYKSEHDMLTLIRNGESRKKAYEIVQKRFF